MRNLIVVGYPKSGCTWVTRLVAELVNCPVAGFWQRAKDEIAVEGKERVSNLRCYKAHQELADLGLSPEQVASDVIYVLRDPRDIAISAANFFQFDRFPKLAALFRKIPRGEKLYRHTLYPMFAPRRYRLEKMTDALLDGSAEVHNWCRVSWGNHLRPYAKAGVPIVRYEDLLENAEAWATQILGHLKIGQSPAMIAAAVERQSFAWKKEALLRSGETGRAKFLRVGKSGQWRQELPPDLRERFKRELNEELTAWGYCA